MNEKASVPGEQVAALRDSENVEVDITNNSCLFSNITSAVEDPDATEYSSSFADTNTDTEKGSEPSEAEVESQYFGDSDLASPYGVFGSIFQKRKKLTNHWRNFIHPLMWRCKWTELKIKELESQVLKYSKKLAAYEDVKHSIASPSTVEGCCSKSLPFDNHMYKRKTVKRRKRKCVENTTDPTAYMSDHVLFAYLESKRSNQDGSSVLDDFGNTANHQRGCDENEKFGIDSTQFLLDFKESDSIEEVLKRIDAVQSRVQKLKNQLDTVLPKSAIRFSSSENVSLAAPFDAETSFIPSPTFSECNGETFSVGGINAAAQHLPSYELGDLVLPESALSSYGEAIHVPDIIESTVGLLSAADVTFPEPQVGDSCEDMLDNILMPTAGLSDCEKISGEAMNSPCDISIVKDEKDTTDIPLTGALPKEEPPSLQASLPSGLQLAGNRKKRGERKGLTSGWSSTMTQKASE